MLTKCAKIITRIHGSGYMHCIIYVKEFNSNCNQSLYKIFFLQVDPASLFCVLPAEQLDPVLAYGDQPNLTTRAHSFHTTGTEGLAVLCVLGSLVRIVLFPIYFCSWFQMFEVQPLTVNVSCYRPSLLVVLEIIPRMLLCPNSKQLSTSIAWDLLQACLVLLAVLLLVLHRNCVCEKVTQL